MRCLSLCSCRPCSRPARRRGGCSAPTTSSSSGSPSTITKGPTTSSRRAGMVIRTSDRRWLLCSIISRRRTCTTRSTSVPLGDEPLPGHRPERDHRREVTNESTILGGRLSGAEAGASSRKERECTATDSRQTPPRAWGMSVLQHRDSCYEDGFVDSCTRTTPRSFIGTASHLHPETSTTHGTRFASPFRACRSAMRGPEFARRFSAATPWRSSCRCERGRLARPALQGTAPGTWAIRLRHEEPIRPVATSAPAGERPGGFLAH